MKRGTSIVFFSHSWRTERPDIQGILKGHLYVHSYVRLRKRWLQERKKGWMAVFLYSSSDLSECPFPQSIILFLAKGRREIRKSKSLIFKELESPSALTNVKSLTSTILSSSALPGIDRGHPALLPTWALQHKEFTPSFKVQENAGRKIKKLKNPLPCWRCARSHET